MAAWPVGIASHTWQSCSSAGSNIGFSAMINSAKVLACSAYDVFMDTKIIDEAKIEFDKSLDGQNLNHWYNFGNKIYLGGIAMREKKLKKCLKKR